MVLPKSHAHKPHLFCLLHTPEHFCLNLVLPFKEKLLNSLGQFLLHTLCKLLFHKASFQLILSPE